jgi:hypothetical protein
MMSEIGSHAVALPAHAVWMVEPSHIHLPLERPTSFGAL